MKTMPKPCDSDHFGLGRVGEYFTDFPNQNVWGKYNKSKNDLSFLIYSEIAWGVCMGMWCVEGSSTKRMG